jgi:hypothetical protein
MNGLSKTNSRLWKRFSSPGPVVAASSRAGSVPEPLKKRWWAFSGMPKRLPSDHSNVWRRSSSGCQLLEEVVLRVQGAAGRNLGDVRIEELLVGERQVGAATAEPLPVAQLDRGEVLDVEAAVDGNVLLLEEVVVVADLLGDLAPAVGRDLHRHASLLRCASALGYVAYRRRWGRR